MIPEIIHYCWFGKKPLSKDALRCIDGWKEKLPGYEIREWNEDCFDVNSIRYVREAYEAKKWAFVSDYVRLYALVTFGGIYMDTDVEVIKPLDKYLEYKAVAGFQSDNEINTGLMACEKAYPVFEKLLHDYDGRCFKKEDGTYDVKYTNVDAVTACLSKMGFRLDNSFQVKDGFALFPKDVFCAKDYLTREVHITENTVTVHHFEGSWTAPDEKLEARIIEKTNQWNAKGLGRVLTEPIRFGRRIKWKVEGKSITKIFRKKGGK